MITATNKIWIADDDRSIRWVLEKAFQQAGMSPRCFESGDAVLKQLSLEQPEVLITDIRMPGMNGLELLKQIKLSHPELPIIVMTAHSDLDSAVSSFQGGAFDYLPKPFDIDEAVDMAQRALTLTQENKTNNIVTTEESSQEIIGEAPAMQEVFRAIGRLSKSSVTVLINGESGTGKELVAHALHRHSPRKQQAFIALNMAAIPKDLMESELFGHEKGAFTGANQQRKGRFEQADGGTLFLDEIGDMPADTQTRLLRVLSDGEFYRVGGHVPVKVDVRIIAATHQNLEQQVKDHQFREDLFHRINVIRIHLPRLTDRREDIPQLMTYFFHRAAEELAVESKTLSPEAEDYLLTLTWPGNVRQLENLCRWLTVMASGREIHINDLPPELKNELKEQLNEQPTKSHDSNIASGDINWEQALRLWAENELAHGHQNLLNTATPMFERVMVESAMKKTAGRRKEAAEILGWGRNTLSRKIKDLSLFQTPLGK